MYNNNNHILIKVMFQGQLKISYKCMQQQYRGTEVNPAQFKLDH